MSFDPNTATQIAAGIATSGAAIAGAIYAAIRKVKHDSSADSVDAKTQALVDNINAQLESERIENKGLREAVERVATERNEAVQTVGKLEGHVSALEHQVKLLTSQVQQLEEENKALALEVHNLRFELKEFIISLREANSPL